MTPTVFDNFAKLAYGNWRDLPIFSMSYLYKFIRSQFRERNKEIPIEKFRSHVLSSNTMTLLYARQSEIFTEFPVKDSFKLLDDIWCFLEM